MPNYTQEDRPLKITTPLGEDVLLIYGFRGQEEISHLFDISALNRCPRVRGGAPRRRISASLRSSMSVLVPNHLTMFHGTSRSCTVRKRLAAATVNQKCVPRRRV